MATIAPPPLTQFTLVLKRKQRVCLGEGEDLYGWLKRNYPYDEFYCKGRPIVPGDMWENIPGFHHVRLVSEDDVPSSYSDDDEDEDV